ncbi:MAG: hypothetical protein A3B79_05440 [Deltaproteobacteria bacterium RIFCSPHIGHO2_02_FULL_50_15]|nr:MAG: hypothetical protein A3B79_05440 [Deltaproteobacteria bacterium RIFCSPHIGHO2_02_FULL_50_15]
MQDSQGRFLPRKADRAIKKLSDFKLFHFQAFGIQYAIYKLTTPHTPLMPGKNGIDFKRSILDPLGWIVLFCMKGKGSPALPGSPCLKDFQFSRTIQYTTLIPH